MRAQPHIFQGQIPSQGMTQVPSQVPIQIRQVSSPHIQPLSTKMNVSNPNIRILPPQKLDRLPQLQHKMAELQFRQGKINQRIRQLEQDNGRLAEQVMSNRAKGERQWQSKLTALEESIANAAKRGQSRQIKVNGWLSNLIAQLGQQRQSWKLQEQRLQKSLNSILSKQTQELKQKQEKEAELQQRLQRLKQQILLMAQRGQSDLLSRRISSYYADFYSIQYS